MLKIHQSKHYYYIFSDKALLYTAYLRPLESFPFLISRVARSTSSRVDVVSEMNPEIVRAHKEKDTVKQKELLSWGKGDFDVFICVSKFSHAFILCAPDSEAPADHSIERFYV